MIHSFFNIMWLLLKLVLIVVAVRIAIYVIQSAILGIEEAWRIFKKRH